MLNVTMLSVVILSVAMLRVVVLSVVMLNVVLLSVAAPYNIDTCLTDKSFAGRRAEFFFQTFEVFVILQKL
jgi:hypothetical protein